MASATEKITFTCPSCTKVLRTSTRPPADKKVKCPACGHPFVPEISDEEEATRFQEKPTAKSKAAPKDDDDPDQAPRSKKSRDDDDDDRPRSKKKSRAEDDDEEDAGPPKKRRRYDDDDDDDLPVKKKSTKKSGSPMLLIALFVLLAGGGLFSCALCGFGAFVWPGFFRTNNAALAAFVPPDANMVVGANPKLLKNKFAHLERIMRRQNAFNQGPKQAEWEDITFNCERMIAFGNATNFENAAVAVYQSNSSDIAKVKRNPHLGPAQNVGGHANVHKATAEGERQGLMPWVAFPGDNFVLTSKREQDLVAALDHAKKKGKTNPTWEMGRHLDKSTMWVAFTPDAKMLGDLRRQLEMGGMMMPPQLQGLRNAAPALGDIKGLTVAMDMDAKEDFNVSASLICKNADDAAKIKTGVDDAWKLMLIGLNQLAGMQFPGQPPIPRTFITDLNTTSFSVQGANVTATMKIQSQTITELVRIGAQQNNFPGPGPIMPPPPINPPPFNPPPFNPPPFNPPPNFNPKPVGAVPPTFLNLVGGQATFNGNLQPNDNTLNGKLHKQFNITFEQGKMYQIDHKRAGGGFGMDPYLILIGPDGRVLAQNDDFAGLDSRIVHRADRTGTYQIMATSLGGRDTGPFTLTVRQIGN